MKTYNLTFLFLKTDYFHMVNPPEHGLVETANEKWTKKKNVHRADVHMGMEKKKKSKWFVTEVQAFKHQVCRHMSDATSPTAALQNVREYL